jgi:hypothetical protein
MHGNKLFLLNSLLPIFFFYGIHCIVKVAIPLGAGME